MTARVTHIRRSPAVRCDGCNRPIFMAKGKREAVVAELVWGPGVEAVTESFHPQCYDGRHGPAQRKAS